MSDFVRDFLESHGVEARPPTQFTTHDGTDLIIPTGARNDTLAAIYGFLLKSRIPPNIAAAMLRGVGTSPETMAVPLDLDEINEIVDHLKGRTSAEPFGTALDSLVTVAPGMYVPDLEWLIPGVIPAEGLTLLYGLPAQGKSYTAQSIAIAVALGAPWLGRAPYGERPRKVAYWDWERRGKMFMRRITQLARGLDEVGFSLDYYEVRVPLADYTERMRGLVLTHGYEFGIIDSLSIAMMTADMISASEVIPSMFALHEIGIPILALDHQKKTGQQEDLWRTGAFGSIFKEAVASCVWQAGKTNASFTDGFMDFKLHHRKNNFDQAPPDFCVRLWMEPDSVRLELISELPPELRVLDEINERGEMTKSQIMSVLGQSEPTARRLINKLLEDGKIRVAFQSEGGRTSQPTTYTLTELPESVTVNE